MRSKTQMISPSEKKKKDLALPPAPSRPSRMPFLRPISRPPHTGPSRGAPPQALACPSMRRRPKSAGPAAILVLLPTTIGEDTRELWLCMSLPPRISHPQRALCAGPVEQEHPSCTFTAWSERHRAWTVLGGNSRPRGNEQAPGRLAAGMLPPSYTVLPTPPCSKAGRPGSYLPYSAPGIDRPCYPLAPLPWSFSRASARPNVQSWENWTPLVAQDPALSSARGRVLLHRRHAGLAATRSPKVLSRPRIVVTRHHFHLSVSASASVGLLTPAVCGRLAAGLCPSAPTALARGNLFPGRMTLSGLAWPGFFRIKVH